MQYQTVPLTDLTRSAQSKNLPDGFSDLKLFVNEWALSSEEERFIKLHSVDLHHLGIFYHAMINRIDQILDYLDQYKLEELPEDARTLFYLAMTFSETAHPIDLKWPDVDFTDAYPWQAFQFRTVSTEPNS